MTTPPPSSGHPSLGTAWLRLAAAALLLPSAAALLVFGPVAQAGRASPANVDLYPVDLALAALATAGSLALGVAVLWRATAASRNATGPRVLRRVGALRFAAYLHLLAFACAVACAAYVLHGISHLA